MANTQKISESVNAEEHHESHVSHNSTDSSNMKLITIFLTLFLSFFAGLICYVCTRDRMSEQDKKQCSLVLWILFAIQIIVIVAFICVYAFAPGMR